MNASNSFENNIHQVQNSNLNFKIDLSPFSAVISLKKSYLRDKSGNFIFPSPFSEISWSHNLSEESQRLRTKNVHPENVIKSIKTELKDSVIDCEETHQMKGDFNHLKTLIHVKKEPANE